MEITIKEDMYSLSGRLDENATFDSLKKAPDPLKINVGGVSSINSVGIRRFLAFTLEWSPRKIRYYECTPDFIANVNVIPQLLGSEPDRNAIRSFFVPFSCERCKRVENILFQREDIQVSQKGDIEIPGANCSKCKEALDLDVEKIEYFVFLTSYKD